jgi:hypothetical protein
MVTSSLRGQKALKDGQQPCVTLKDRCQLANLLWPTPFVFRGPGGMYAATVCFLLCLKVFQIC